MDVGFLFVFLVGVICRARNAKCVRMKGVLFFYSCSCVVFGQLSYISVGTYACHVWLLLLG